MPDGHLRAFPHQHTESCSQCCDTLQGRAVRADKTYHTAQHVAGVAKVACRDMGAKGNFIAEDRRSDVVIGRTAGEPEQHQIVQITQLIITQPERLTETNSQQARAQGAIHRRARPDVSCQRKREDEFC